MHERDKIDRKQTDNGTVTSIEICDSLKGWNGSSDEFTVQGVSYNHISDHTSMIRPSQTTLHPSQTLIFQANWEKQQ